MGSFASQAQCVPHRRADNLHQKGLGRCLASTAKRGPSSDLVDGGLQGQALYFEFYFRPDQADQAYSLGTNVRSSCSGWDAREALPRHHPMAARNVAPAESPYRLPTATSRPGAHTPRDVHGIGGGRRARGHTARAASMALALMRVGGPASARHLPTSFPSSTSEIKLPWFGYTVRGRSQRPFHVPLARTSIAPTRRRNELLTPPRPGRGQFPPSTANLPLSLP